MEYWEFEDKVKTKADFNQFMELLRQDWDKKHTLIRRADGADTQINEQGWENAYLPDFLEALQAWVGDSQSLSKDFPYNELARILSASVVYE